MGISEKNTHLFAVYHLLIDTVFCLVVRANKRKQVIQFRKPYGFDHDYD